MSWKVQAIREDFQRRFRDESPEDREQRQSDAERGVERAFYDAAEKVRENRLRRMAQRQGLQLMKSRRRDWRAVDYGRYMIANPETNYIVAGGTPHAYTMDLDQVEQYLTGL